MRLRIVLLVQVDSPRVPEHRRARRDEVLAEHVVGRAGVRRAAEHGDGAPAQDFLDGSAQVRQLCFVGEGGEAAGADDGVQFALRGAERVRVRDEGEERGAERRRGRVGPRAEEGRGEEGEVAVRQRDVGGAVVVACAQLEEELAEGVGDGVGFAAGGGGAGHVAPYHVDEGHVGGGLARAVGFDVGFPWGEDVGDVLERGEALDEVAAGDVERGAVLHELEALADDGGVQAVDAVAVRDAEDDG